MNRQFEKHFDELSNEYDAYMLILPDYAKTHLIIIELASPKKEYNAVDIGTGTGALAMMMAPMVKEVIAIDISKKMLDEAKSKANERDIHNIKFIKTTGNNLHSIQDSSIDIIVSNLVFHHLNDKEKACLIKECYMKLRPNGKFISGDIMKTKSWYLGIEQILDNHKKRYGYVKAHLMLLWQLIDSTIINKEHHITPQKFIDLLTLSGFKDVRVNRVGALINVVYGIK
jgi:ubiquinone/menaquinone biosynthesis C-methylase UbiE